MAKSGDIQSEMIFTTNQMAELLGLTPRRIQQLAEEGVIVKSSRGKYVAAESIQNYIQFQSESGGGASEVDYFDERALHERVKRRKAELELAVMEGDLHRSDDVRLVMNDMIVTFRSRILAMPSKLAPQMLGQSELPVVLDLLTKEVKEAASELSEYDPEKFYAVSEEYVGLTADAEDTS
jgi:phage terminase Nu1 subunit (DNA packaging protein)